MACRQTCANLIQLFVYRNIKLLAMEDGSNLFLLGKKLTTRGATLGWLRDIALIPISSRNQT